MRDPWYWRREPAAHESGLPARIAPLRAPRLRASFERPDASLALWLEDVPEAPPWTPVRLDELPQTLVHNDSIRGNVLGGAADVVVDWAYCGLGAVGLDAGVLALDALFDAAVEPSLADEVVEAVWEGYAAGLGVLADAARRPYRAGTALRLAWMPSEASRAGAPARDAELVPLLRRLADAGRRL